MAVDAAEVERVKWREALFASMDERDRVELCEQYEQYLADVAEGRFNAVWSKPGPMHPHGLLSQYWAILKGHEANSTVPLVLPGAVAAVYRDNPLAEPCCRCLQCGYPAPYHADGPPDGGREDDEDRWARYKRAILMPTCPVCGGATGWHTEYTKAQ